MKQQGFTLIELLIVIAIIGILTAVLVPNLYNARLHAQKSGVTAYIRHCITALETARDDTTGQLPTTITSCQDPFFNPPIISRPSYVISDTVVVNPNKIDFTITAIDIQNRTFMYDGNTIQQH